MNKLGTETFKMCGVRGEGMMFIKHLLDEKCSHPGISFIIRATQGDGLSLSCLIVEVTENQDVSRTQPSAQLGTNKGRIWSMKAEQRSVLLLF